MKYITIKIKKCFDCPYINEYGYPKKGYNCKRHWESDENHILAKIDNPKKIPSWCSLSDKK